MLTNNFSFFKESFAATSPLELRWCFTCWAKDLLEHLVPVDQDLRCIPSQNLLISHIVPILRFGVPRLLLDIETLLNLFENHVIVKFANVLTALLFLLVLLLSVKLKAVDAPLRFFQVNFFLLKLLLRI